MKQWRRASLHYLRSLPSFSQQSALLCFVFFCLVKNTHWEICWQIDWLLASNKVLVYPVQCTYTLFQSAGMKKVEQLTSKYRATSLNESRKLVCTGFRFTLFSSTLLVLFSLFKRKPHSVAFTSETMNEEEAFI